MTNQPGRLARYIKSVNTNPYRRSTQAKTQIAAACRAVIKISVITVLLGYVLALLMQRV